MRALLRIAAVLFLAVAASWSGTLHAAAAAPASAAAPADTAKKDTAAFAPAAPQTAASPGGGLSTLAAGQTANATTPADPAAVDTAAAKDRFAPTSSSYMRSGDLDVTLGSKMDMVSHPGRGWSLTNSIMVEQRRYRSRDAEDVGKNLANQAAKVEPGLYAVAISIGESYRKNKTFGSGRFGQEIVIDNETANLKFDLTKPLLGAQRSLLSVGAEGRRGQNDFKYDNAISGSVSGTLGYTAGDILNVVGGFGTMRKRERSEIGTIQFGAMPSNTDTVRVGAGFGRGEKKLLDVRYNRYEGVDRRVMPPLGNSFEVLDDPSKAKREEAKKSGRELLVLSSVRPFSSLVVDFDFSHVKDSQRYLVDERLSMESEKTSLAAAAVYRYAKDGGVRINVSTRVDSTNYGPSSLSSYWEREHKVSLGLTHKLTDSLSIAMNGATFLRQRFYVKRAASPRDADYLYYHGDVSIKAAPFPRIGTDVVMSADRYETINMAASISGDNRVDYQYRVAPTITLRPAKWVQLSQEYAIKIEFTDFVYTEDKNYLNRTTTLGTKATLTVLRPLVFGFRHSYLMKDTGSYLMRAGERRYSKSSGNEEHSLYLDATYQPNPDFMIRASSDFRNQQSNIFGAKDGRRIITSKKLFESGGMRLGFVRKKNIGSSGAIDLNVAYVRNFGKYITEARKKYWDVNSAITLRF